MQRHKLSNVLLENSWQFFRAPAMYCSSNAPVTCDDPAKGEWVLQGPGTFDFTTFFNALPTSKWMRYTCAREFFLHLELKGAACTFAQTRADTYTWHVERLEDTVRDIAVSEEWVTLDIPLELNDDVLVGFLLETQGAVQIRNSYYYTEVDDENIRPVELALCTTTFKNENYILPNVELVKTRIIETNEPISEHFSMHVVDNGRTLDAKDVESERIFLHPNPNAGGAGGFARGMIEAMEQTPRATHVLLMDDDVSISPESIIRTFNLLSIVNGEYSEAFLSGAMMSMDQPNLRYEDVGFVACNGKYFPAKNLAYVDVLHDCVANETFIHRNPEEAGYDTDRMSQSYAAWWYCVIPVSVIDREGLPLPIFVRTDDVEYSLRAHAKIMTMNGICVWHAPFKQRYSAAVERYQMPRNVLIGQFTSGMAPMSDFIGDLKIGFELELKKYNYDNAALVLDAFEDFLKGPSFIMEKGAAERSYLDHLKKAEKLLPLDDIKEDALALGVDLDTIPATQFDHENYERDDHRSFVERIRDNMTVNGHRMVRGDYYDKGSVAVISAAGWLYPVDELRKKEYIIAIDAPSKKGIIRKMDKERFNRLWDRFHRDMVEFRANKDRLRKEYEAARPVMTSLPFWKQYLGID